MKYLSRMNNQTISHKDKKANCRKLNHKIQTLTKKSVELSTQHHCNILLIIYSEHNKHWIQYCSSSADTLFFGYQTAKEHLEKIEKYDNSNYHKLISSLSSPDNSISPKPAKFSKVYEKPVNHPQPIKVAEKGEIVKSSMSTLSTEYAIAKPSEVGILKIENQNKLAIEKFSLGFDKKAAEHESSSDFDFDHYFVSDYKS
ncbi:hypothetical protein SteCoe_30935 [Stentor coeruleus]|uniref:MADS-box domain-containing protein n=1 Tax=Stentor coeruleus TaxID=5963 RepID=A0A1R2B2F7_9CILI|nr:hypothetical protein SteCoe_30935 [Stentor coeruleus]